MQRRFQIRLIFLMTLTASLATALAASFARPIGLRYSSETNYTFMNLRRTYAFNSGMAFHSGGLVLYRQTIYAELGEEAGLHMVRSDHEDMRSTIYSALHPMEG